MAESRIMFAPLSADVHLGTSRPTSSLKRCRDGPNELRVSSKRPRLGPVRHTSSPRHVSAAHSEDVRDVIRHQFGLEVLLKHNELRLINQELAKCQVALEQLRRCHLIPYPQNCPTPAQMLDISSGTGPALARPKPGEPTPRWAPPFGVVDGPYARHYAKWLIPHSVFDGPGSQPKPAPRPRAHVVEGRTTRNSFAEQPAKARPARGASGQKLQALSNGYHPPKDRGGGPCILKRADGMTVKLVCLDCNRENFSSTQGFINHCRIAHRRDFKSHGEAAAQSGHPIDVTHVVAPLAPDERPAPAPPKSNLVHPLAQQDMTEQQAYAALRARINDSLKLYHAGKLPGVLDLPLGPPCSSRAHDAASQTPHLSRLMETRNFAGNLGDIVADAKTKSSSENMPPAEESDDGGVELVAAPLPARTPVVVGMRVPARTVKSPVPRRTSSSKGRLPLVTSTTSGLGLSKSSPTTLLSDEDTEDMEETNLSPNTVISNVAPSLVSDDGDYDDTDEGSSVCGASDHLDGAAVSDVAEISLDEDHEPRALRRGSGGVTAQMKLHKDEAKHVTIMSPVRGNAKGRRPSRRVRCA